MNNKIIHSQPKPTTSSHKFIIFNVAQLTLALPIESVYKVVNRPTISGSGLASVGITQVGDRELAVVDLHQQLFRSNSTEQLSNNGYLIITQTTLGELYGIPVTTTPVLIDIPVSKIRLLPESYRRADTLYFASHIAVISQQNKSLTIFLLDVDLLIDPNSPWKSTVTSQIKPQVTPRLSPHYSNPQQSAEQVQAKL